MAYELINSHKYELVGSENHDPTIFIQTWSRREFITLRIEIEIFAGNLL